jgi:pentatricopeptide repeat protein
LAEAHAALGLYEEQYAWNWHAAEQEFQKALLANPNYPTAHQWYGEFLAFQGRTDESIREIEKAFQLDPLSLSTNTARAFPYLAERKYQEVIDRLQPAFELDSDFPQALFYLARAYEGLGKYGKAIETYQRAVDASGGSTFFSSAMINSLVKNGEYQRAERLLNGIVKTDNSEHLSRYILARGMAALGKKEAALAALEQALETRDPLLVVLKVDPNFDALRGEDSYQKIIQKVGL